MMSIKAFGKKERTDKQILFCQVFYQGFQGTALINSFTFYRENCREPTIHPSIEGDNRS